MTAHLQATKEKKAVALGSIFAAIFLTISKFTVGILTGSLGILSEAMHSGLDLVAAVVTYFAVKFGDRPADEYHNYGHGKIENLSALFETLLLLFTCIWIIYEAYQRIINNQHTVEVTFWSFAVIIVSIIIDITRSRALMKAAKKYNSQALEADAIHFSSDILSSAVVIIGLIGSLIGYPEADAISALMVAGIVIYISAKLGKKSIDALIDRRPDISTEEITKFMNDSPEIVFIHNLKLRSSGSDIFIDLNIHVDGNKTLNEAHTISHNLEKKIKLQYEKAVVHIHIEPDNEEDE